MFRLPWVRLGRDSLTRNPESPLGQQRGTSPLPTPRIVGSTGSDLQVLRAGRVLPHHSLALVRASVGFLDLSFHWMGNAQTLEWRLATSGFGAVVRLLISRSRSLFPQRQLDVQPLRF